ncbi:sporulation integral membrane protein YtvI [[Clostridium] polysaccharolyticum]|uniref:Sporulation integral membrane protein YtvI n=1 Tax=[Clostridium] polysaccharolyticum TaxID=29364 RepID=A0A1H9YL07_9FIRM|nr:sporulation integral membrane protein YtvI [[Clostridium] polysaccharolyticum]SES69738.1 sporulation integral membrane protein YtvI [[Clostridium] polysaccharolyticum]
MNKKGLYIRIGVTLLLAAAIVLLCIFVLPRLIRFFFPFVIGWIIAMIANPLVRFMEKRIKIVRKHSSAIIIIAVLAAVIGIIYGVGSFLIRELLQFLRDMPDIYTALSLKFDLFINKAGKLVDKLPNTDNSSLDRLANTINSGIANFMANYELPSFSEAGNFAKNIADGIFSAIIILISSYFFIADRDKIVAAVRRIIPNYILEQFDMVVNNFKQAIGGYFRAQFKLMLIVFAILWLGFAILGVKYSILLAIVVAFIDLLPFFGTGAVIGPWVVYDLIIGKYADAIFLVVIYLLCQIIKQVLQPKMVGDSIGISPLSTLFFMFIGYKLGGFGGLIIGIPIGMVIVNFYHSGLFDSVIRGVKILAADLAEFMKF